MKSGRRWALRIDIRRVQCPRPALDHQPHQPASSGGTRFGMMVDGFAVEMVMMVPRTLTMKLKLNLSVNTSPLAIIIYVGIWTG